VSINLLCTHSWHSLVCTICNFKCEFYYCVDRDENLILNIFVYLLSVVSVYIYLYFQSFHSLLC